MSKTCKNCIHSVYDSLFHCYLCLIKDKYIHILKTNDECSSWKRKTSRFFKKKERNDK